MELKINTENESAAQHEEIIYRALYTNVVAIWQSSVVSFSYSYNYTTLIEKHSTATINISIACFRD